MQLVVFTADWHGAILKAEALWPKSDGWYGHRATVKGSN